MSAPGLQAGLDRDGYAIVREVARADVLAQLQKLTHQTPTDSEHRRGGVRSPFQVFAGMLGLVRQTNIPGIARSELGDGAFAVRSILFDKTPERNWAVPWHRDETIAVRARHDLPGFGPWSEKAGVVHVRPPAVVLDRMVTVRLHLDDCDANNGALSVRPGTHLGADATDEVLCAVHAGDAVVMRPRIEHASAKASNPSRRRVLHVECAADDLPAPLEWAERIGLSSSSAS